MATNSLRFKSLSILLAVLFICHSSSEVFAAKDNRHHVTAVRVSNIPVGLPIELCATSLVQISATRTVTGVAASVGGAVVTTVRKAIRNTTPMDIGFDALIAIFGGVVSLKWAAIALAAKRGTDTFQVLKDGRETVGALREQIAGQTAPFKIYRWTNMRGSSVDILLRLTESKEEAKELRARLSVFQEKAKQLESAGLRVENLDRILGTESLTGIAGIPNRSQAPQFSEINSLIADATALSENEKKGMVVMVIQANAADEYAHAIMNLPGTSKFIENDEFAAELEELVLQGHKEPSSGSVKKALTGAAAVTIHAVAGVAHEVREKTGELTTTARSAVQKATNMIPTEVKDRARDGARQGLRILRSLFGSQPSEDAQAPASTSAPGPELLPEGPRQESEDLSSTGTPSGDDIADGKK